jgi:hypothetical protein
MVPVLSEKLNRLKFSLLQCGVFVIGGVVVEVVLARKNRIKDGDRGGDIFVNRVCQSAQETG